MKQIWVPDPSILLRWLWLQCQHRLLDGVLILLLAYAVFMRNISIQISIDAEQWSFSNATAQLPVQKLVPEQVFTKSATLAPPLVNKTDIPAVPVKSKPVVPAPKPVINKTSVNTKGNKLSHFANAAFVLNPGLAKKTAREIVVEKNKICEQYISRYRPIAKAEQDKFGIPASITLAQGILESDAGGSQLSKRNNNHFGVKCFSRRCKKGHCSNFTDDTHKDFFKIYQNAWESFRDHSKFLEHSRYKHLKKLGKDDYKGWAYGLKKAGYATDKRYAEKLILIIETLKLYEYD